MSNQLHNGNALDINVLAGHSLAVSSITGTYTATIVAGTGTGTVLATDSTDGATYGPYATSVVIRIRAGAVALIDYDSALTPSLTYRSPMFGAPAISGEVASLVDGDGDPVDVGGGGGSVTVTVNDQSAAAANTAAIQAALNGGGLVQILTPGVVYVTGATPILTIYSGTRLVLGAGTTIRLKDSDGGHVMLRNANYASTVKAVTGNLTTVATAHNGLMKVAVSCTGHSMTSGANVLIKGDTTEVFSGVHRDITVVDANSFYFYMSFFIAGKNSSGTITAALADANISVEGGTWDYNYLNGNTSGVLLNSMMMIFNKIGYSGVRNCTILNASKYCVFPCNADNFHCDNIYASAPSAAIQFLGPTWNTQLSNIRGEAGDDFIAWTTGNGALYAAYDLPDSGGNILNPVAKDIYISRHGLDGVFFGAVSGQTIKGALVDGLHCTGQGKFAVGVDNWTATDSFITDLTIHNVSGGYGDQAAVPAFRFSTSGKTTLNTLKIDSLTIDGYHPKNPQVYPPITIFNAITIKRFVIANIDIPDNSLSDIIWLNGATVKVDHLLVTDSRVGWDLNAAPANPVFVYLVGVAVKDVIVKNCYVTATGTTRTGRVVSIFAPITSATRIQIVDTYHDGYTLCFAPNTITTVPTVTFRGVKSAGLYLASSSDSYNMIIDGVELIACAGGVAINNGATSKTIGIHAQGIKNTAGTTLFNYGTTNTFNVTGSDGSLTMKTDTAGHTFNLSTGCVINDTQTAAPGIYAKGPTAYTRIAT